MPRANQPKSKPFGLDFQPKCNTRAAKPGEEKGAVIDCRNGKWVHEPRRIECDFCGRRCLPENVRRSGPDGEHICRTCDCEDSQSDGAIWHAEQRWLNTQEGR